MLAKFTGLVIPILIYKQLVFRIKPHIVTMVLLWLLSFVGYPALLFILDRSLDAAERYILYDPTLFFLVWLTEAFLLINHWFQHTNRTLFKFKLTLDSSLFTLSVIFSLFWALIFNSIDDPMNNQPLEIIFDFARLFNHFDEFLSYWLQFQVIYGLVFIFYLIHRHLLINKVLDQYGNFHYLWLSALFLLLYYPLASQFALYLPINTGESTLIPSANHNPFDYYNARFIFAIYIISLPITLAFQWTRKSQQLAELAKQNIHTELVLLQQQINPHFLFNSLNNIYALCLTKSNQAPKLVQQLADLLRFVVYKGGQEKVALKEEVEYLQGYLSLQQVRVSNKCQFDTDFQEALPNLKISPLLLIVLVENAFKHGVEPTDSDAWLKVKLKVEGNILYFECANSIVKKNSIEQTQSIASHQTNESHGGVGLDNLRRRLALLYAGKHELKIQHKENAYHVQLTLECQ